MYLTMKIMAIQIPVGREVLNEEEVYVRRGSGKYYAYPKKIESFTTNAIISSAYYALVQEGNQARYAISMKQEYNGSEFISASVEDLNNGLFIPTPAIFMPHYINVNEASQGKNVLYDANGDVIEKERLHEYAAKLNRGCWVWINAMFPKEKTKDTGFKGLDLAIINGFEEEQPIFKREPLERCLEDDGWADLESLNRQGFPTEKAKIGKYELGKTIYFLAPFLREDDPEVGFVAGFVADSDGAFLYCYWGPQYSDAVLGVFLCAEGTAQKNS